MNKTVADLAKAEWSVMEALWSRGNGTATELQGDLTEAHGWAYSTVKTMLDRLVDKGYVKSRRVGNVYEYSARIKRKSVVARIVDDVYDRVLKGSLEPLMDRLLKARRLSREESVQLREMLDRYEEEDHR
ncbi:MAG: BlaI/MecI/CopY family transcriptional regulator [Pirellulaceae bacterium]|nr:BlaI/MecI/CopY family transcriptional regulator [Planctomycetaceae bacterium]HIM29126.1 BlaI/MecI/CopY family transcriptional regulator [Planctomycetota bacterium]